MEKPILVTNYGIYLQIFIVTSILLGIYGLTVATRTLQEVAPGKELSLEVDKGFTLPQLLYQDSSVRWQTTAVKILRKCLVT